MPLVLVRHKADVPPGTLRVVVDALPAIVASALSTENNLDGTLRPGEIVVWVMEGSSLDANTKPLEVVIFANGYLERELSLGRRRRFIVDRLRQVAPVLCGRGYAWVLLAQGSYEEL